ncbi:hypothetical protein A8C56_19865 [Niabella ginsenosidivorans]|uniref:WG repeat-containing protein n=1 Tax=Niabella ginsenosidivorans TaxID=1176587 RepID=A0A1A9I5V6_9BACT|nr:WG repeat-containing protein [Niabella ginsenosidivorans]ANH82943.1 hypothetical protein A8C56_19865 [Niabella ginsenosidivorans]
MKRIKFYIVLLALLSPAVLFAQHQLYYFQDPRSMLLGVKDQSGKIIIPARGHVYYDVNLRAPITDSLINLLDVRHRRDSAAAYAFGSTYDRRGNFLFHPMAFDNGPDYFVEGLSRCVDKGKVGFVNLQGQIIIQPQWDWASPFNYGYASACNGCYLDRESDPEHPSIALSSNGEKVYINRQGDTVPLMSKRQSDKDLPVDGGFLPYPFHYNRQEQAIVDSMNAMDVLSKIYTAFLEEPVTGKSGQLHFQILERPSETSPYYQIQGFTYGDMQGVDQFLFLRDEAGQLFHPGPEGKLIPFNRWLKASLQNCDRFFRQNRNAPNRFNVSEYLKGL